MSHASNRLPVLAAEIRREHVGVKAAAAKAAEHAIAAGNALIEARALLNHGEWLPWLKGHVGFSERTAQLYMKIVRLGLKSETVADLGVRMAASAIAVIQDANYNPLHGRTDGEIQDWLLFRRYVSPLMGEDGADRHVEWLLRQGWTLEDWLGDEGSHYRKSWGYSNPVFAASFIEGWRGFLTANQVQP